MKIDLYCQQVATNTISHEFKINMSRETVAHFTKLLVTSQYSDPLKASIREIISNAYDANLVAGNPDAPIDITQKDDRVIIRDYGSGLSIESLTGLYTVIGVSTKQESEDQIGAFGIGRLAPLAFNNQFVVESFHNGKHYVYCVYLSEEGIPSVTEWDNKNTSEPNGLAVHILYPAPGSPLIQKKAYSVIQELTALSRFNCNYKLDLEDKESIQSSEVRWSPEKKLLERNELKNRIIHTQTVSYKGQDLQVEVYRYKYTYSPIIVDLGGSIYLSNKRYTLDALDEKTYCLALDEVSEEYKKGVQSKYNGKNHTILVRCKPDTIKLTSNREELDDKGYNELSSVVTKALFLHEYPKYLRLVEDYAKNISKRLGLVDGIREIYDFSYFAFNNTLLQSYIKYQDSTERFILSQELTGYKYNIYLDRHRDGGKLIKETSYGLYIHDPYDNRSLLPSGDYKVRVIHKGIHDRIPEIFLKHKKVEESWYYKLDGRSNFGILLKRPKDKIFCTRTTILKVFNYDIEECPAVLLCPDTQQKFDELNTVLTRYNEDIFNYLGVYPSPKRNSSTTKSEDTPTEKTFISYVNRYSKYIGEIPKQPFEIEDLQKKYVYDLWGHYSDPDFLSYLPEDLLDGYSKTVIRLSQSTSELIDDVEHTWKTVLQVKRIAAHNIQQKYGLCPSLLHDACTRQFVQWLQDTEFSRYLPAETQSILNLDEDIQKIFQRFPYRSVIWGNNYTCEDIDKLEEEMFGPVIMKHRPMINNVKRISDGYYIPALIDFINKEQQQCQ